MPAVRQDAVRRFGGVIPQREQMSKPKEHYLITRLQKLRPIFNAIFSRTATTRQVLPAMSASVTTIIKAAQVIQAGLGHIEEGHFDSQEISNELAHLTQFAMGLPLTVERDANFWAYALNLVNPDTFREGVEYCEIEEIENFIQACEAVLAVKLEIQRARELKGERVEVEAETKEEGAEQ